MNASFNPPMVLYIMGAGRCGSTILSIILGAHPQIEAVGEIKAWPNYKGIPRDKKKENENFWKEILIEYISNIHNELDFDNLIKISRKIEVPYKINLRTLIQNKKIKNAYHEHIENLILAIFNVSKKKVLLDSSKNVFRAFQLLRNSNLNVKIIHLVRDPRGVVWSFMKKNIDHKPKKPLTALFDYIALNSISILIKMFYKRKVIKVKYEDLVYKPKNEIYRILSFINLDYLNLLDSINKEKLFKVKYIFDGNRIRNQIIIRFTPDEEWKEKLPAIYKIICNVCAKAIYRL